MSTPIFWDWIRIIRRAKLGFGEGKKRVSSSTVQHVAVMAVTYGDPDGTRIRPSEARLAKVCDRDPKTIRLCLARLREVGLMVRVFEGSSAGRAGMADEYHLAIPPDLFDRVPMLDPDERELIVPPGVPSPTPVKRPRAKTPTAGSPGAAPADPPVDNPASPGAAPGDNTPSDQLPASNHRVQHPGTPGAAPENTGCSTRPPTHAPTTHLPQTNSSPYGAQVEGVSAPRRKPSAKKDQLSYRQPPLLMPVPDFEPYDPAAYAAASATLATLPDCGADLIAAARAELGPEAARPQVVIHAHHIHERRSA